MADRFFLYIDILGFADKVSDKNKIEEIYEIIDDLNIFNNAPYFKTIVFSDTILVYCDYTENEPDANGLVMWMCEWAQDLFARFISKDLHFRAILTFDNFEHEKMKNIEAFYGTALVKAYQQEKQILAMGLYIDNKLLPFCDIFHTSKYSDDLSYVHLMQKLDNISQRDEHYPIAAMVMESTEMQYFVSPDLVYLRNIYKHMNDTSLSPHIRSKYINTWHLIRSRHAALLDRLVRFGFDFNCISELDWSTPIKRSEIGDLVWA